MDDRGASTAARPAETLTSREQEILELLALGYSAREIAQRLNLALSSVKWYVQRLYGKLAVNNKQRAILRASELGLLPAAREATPITPNISGGRANGDSSHSSGPHAPAPSARPASPIHNLPLQVTQFFGREREIAQVIEHLGQHRLVTLIGPGGVGKTRLALRAAEEALKNFVDGLWYIDLAALTDPALVTLQTAIMLGVPDDATYPLSDRLEGFLQGRRALLVFDNCEHLLAACGHLADRLRRACPVLQILAVSREPLGIEGEAVFPVPSLPYPAPGQNLAPADMLSYPAVRLFVDRARLALPGYTLAEADAGAVARICLRLDGIPLAIEMAAARLNVLAAEQLADRLDDTFAVLHAGSRGALPRQQTLRATVDWSYQLLSEPEREMFARLSVFAGGCTLEGIEAVCANDAPADLVAASLLDLLASLVAKSMVVAEGQPGRPTRYRLLEFMRQYAGEKLETGGDRAACHIRHLNFYLAFADRTVTKLLTRERPTWVMQLEAERDNLRQALDWSFQPASIAIDPDAGPWLVYTMCHLWGSYPEHLAWCQRGVAYCEQRGEISPAIYSRLLVSASDAIWVSDPETAAAWLDRSVDLSRSAGPSGREALMWGLFAQAHRRLAEERIDEALASLAESQRLLHALGLAHFGTEPYLSHQGWYEVARAAMAMGQADYVAAKEHAVEGLRLCRVAGDLTRACEALVTLGEVCQRLNDYDQSYGYFCEGLLLTGDLTYAYVDSQRAYILECLAEVEVQRGNLAQAQDYCQASFRQAWSIPDYQIGAKCLETLTLIRVQQGKLVQAAQLAGAAQAFCAQYRRHQESALSLDTMLPGWFEWPDQAELMRVFVTAAAMNAEQAVACVLTDPNN